MGRNSDRANGGKFAPGNPGGPGRPPGAKNKVARLVKDAWQGKATEVAETVLKEALTGDLGACRLILERLYPPPKDMPVEVELPVGDLATVHRAVLDAATTGAITPSEAERLSKVVSDHARIVELTQLQAQVDEIKTILAERGMA